MWLDNAAEKLSPPAVGPVGPFHLGFGGGMGGAGSLPGRPVLLEGLHTQYYEEYAMGVNTFFIKPSNQDSRRVLNHRILKVLGAKHI